LAQVISFALLGGQNCKMLGQIKAWEEEAMMSPKKPKVRCSRWNAAKKPDNIKEQFASSPDPSLASNETFDEFEGLISPGNSPGSSPYRGNPEMMNVPRCDNLWSNNFNTSCVNGDASSLQSNSFKDLALENPFSALQTMISLRNAPQQPPMVSQQMFGPAPVPYQAQYEMSVPYQAQHDLSVPYQAQHDVQYWSMPQIPEVPLMPFPVQSYAEAPQLELSAPAPRRIANKKIVAQAAPSQPSQPPVSAQAPGGAIVGQRLLHLLQGRGLQTLHSMEYDQKSDSPTDAWGKPNRRGDFFGMKVDTQDVEINSDCSTVDTLGVFGLTPNFVHADYGAHSSNVASCSVPFAPTGMTADAGAQDNGTPIIGTVSSSAQLPINHLPLGSPDMPTIGSKGHWLGSCKPCAFYHKDGCENGINCKFCHICDQGAKKRRQKEKLAMRRMGGQGQRPLVGSQSAAYVAYQ